jgi:hypothetical protein
MVMEWRKNAGQDGYHTAAGTWEPRPHPRLRTHSVRYEPGATVPKFFHPDAVVYLKEKDVMLEFTTVGGLSDPQGFHSYDEAKEAFERLYDETKAAYADKQGKEQQDG